MLTISNIYVAFASTTTDQNTVYIVIGVVVFLFILIMAASSGSSAKKVVKKYYCPHCNRQINFAAQANRTLPKHSPPVGAKRNNLRVSSQPRKATSLVNARVQRINGKIYCPYCKKKIIA